MNKAVYTVITDHQKYKLREPLIDNPNWDHMCFTTEPVSSTKWEIVGIEDIECLGMKKLSRYWKIRGLALMHEYDIILYLDSRFTIKVDLDKYFDDFIKSNKLLGVMKHNKRNCAYDEFKFLDDNNMDTHESINCQESKYMAWQFPTNFGLWAPGIMRRKKNVLLEIQKLNFQKNSFL
jgi:hypothetical protein